MTLQEVLREKREFRRSGQSNWYKPEFGSSLILCVEDILAEDWEVKEEEITVTISQLRAAWDIAARKVYAESEVTYLFESERSLHFEALAEELAGKRGETKASLTKAS